MASKLFEAPAAVMNRGCGLAALASLAVLGGSYLWLTRTDSSLPLRRLAAFAGVCAKVPRATRLQSLDGRVSMRVSALGACISSLAVDGRDIVLGFDVDTLLGLFRYYFHSPYFGVIVGRVANRLRSPATGTAGFRVGERQYEVAGNEAGGRTALHGGQFGFDKRVWTLVPSRSLRSGDSADTSVTCMLRSEDGDQGFPGTLDVKVKYSMEEVVGDGEDRQVRNALVVEMIATTDAPTPVCLAQHSYFNLNGHFRRSEAGREIAGIDNHMVEIDASRVTPVDEDLIPTGAFMDVEGTAFDLRPIRCGADGQTAATASTTINPLMVSPRSEDSSDADVDQNVRAVDRGPKESLLLGERIEALRAQVSGALGFDHNYCLDRSRRCPYARAEAAGRPAEAASADIFGRMHRVAKASCAQSGVSMEVYSDQPGVQFYTGNFLDDVQVPGKRDPNGVPLRYGRHTGFCLETQTFPNAANVDTFPDCTLEPDGVYRHMMMYVFD